MSNHVTLEKAIRVISRFGWVRAQELGLYLYPEITTNPDSRRTMTRRAIAHLREMGFIEGRILIGGSEALFLTKAGCQFAAELGEYSMVTVPARFAAKDWKHDCFSRQMLYAESAGNLDRIVTEHQISLYEGAGRRRPDGLVMTMGEWFVVEIEHSRKSGFHLRAQTRRIADAIGGGLEYCGLPISGALIFYPRNIPGVCHRTRLVNALHDVCIPENVGPALQMIGFDIQSKTHAIARLSVSKDRYVLSAMEIELGLPAEVKTGQRRGPRAED